MNHDRRTRDYAFKLFKQDQAVKRPCPFCVIREGEEIIEQTPTMWVFRNRVKYDSFEGIPASEHYMIVPIAHRTILREFTSREKADYLSLLEKYEGEGFSFYGRGLINAERSQPHLHTHVIKLQGRRAKFLVYLSKPYLVLRGRQNTKRA